jgi:hypothetical protein
MTASGINVARAAQIDLHGYTFEDGIPMSKEYAERHGVYGTDGKIRQLLIGDKASDGNGNKGVTPIIVDRNMSDEEFNKLSPLKQKVVQTFRNNPELDIVMAKYSSVSRFNGGTARDMVESPNKKPYVDLDGNVHADAISDLPIIVTHMTVDAKTNIYDKDLDYLLQKIESINLDYKNYENKIVEKFTKNQHLEILLNETYDTTFKFLFNYFEKSNNVVYKFLLERIWGYYFTDNYKNQIKQDPQFFKNPGLETKIFLNQSILLFDMLAWMYNFNNTTGFQNDSLDKINLYKNKIPENWNKISIQLGIPNEINEIVLDCLNTRLSLINPLDAEEIKNLVIKTHSVEKNLILNLDKKIPNVPEIKKKIVKALHDSKEKNIDLLSYLELNNWFELTDSKNLVLKLHLIYVDNVNYIYLFNSPNNNKTYKFDLYRIWSFYKNNNLQKLNIKFVPEEFSMLINKAILQTSVLK